MTVVLQLHQEQPVFLYPQHFCQACAVPGHASHAVEGLLATILTGFAEALACWASRSQRGAASPMQPLTALSAAAARLCSQACRLSATLGYSGTAAAAVSYATTV